MLSATAPVVVRTHSLLVEDQVNWWTIMISTDASSFLEQLKNDIRRSIWNEISFLTYKFKSAVIEMEIPTEIPN